MKVAAPPLLQIKLCVACCCQIPIFQPHKLDSLTAKKTAQDSCINPKVYQQNPDSTFTIPAMTLCCSLLPSHAAANGTILRVNPSLHSISGFSSAACTRLQQMILMQSVKNQQKSDM
jgi:hypothetical protein